MNAIIEKLHPADLTDLADLVAELVMQKLGGSVVSSVLPAWFAEALRYAAAGHQWQNRFVIPLGTGGGFMANFMVAPDGTLHLELADFGSQPAWRGIFRGDDPGDRT